MCRPLLPSRNNAPLRFFLPVLRNILPGNLSWARISYLESCPPWVVLPNCPQMRGDHHYANLTTSLLFYQSAPYNGHKTVLSAEKNAIMLVLCKVCRSNIDHEKTSRLIGDCLRLLLLTWTIWNLHPWLLMCTLVMDPSHGTLDIFHFEEVIYIFSNIFEVPVGLVILKLKYILWEFISGSACWTTWIKLRIRDLSGPSPLVKI